jgi:hypothetical protein
MPLFFASNAINPISIMPRWLQVVSHANPLTYQVDALRTLMLAGGTSSYGVGIDLLILIAVTGIMIGVGSFPVSEDCDLREAIFARDTIPSVFWHHHHSGVDSAGFPDWRAQRGEHAARADGVPQRDFVVNENRRVKCRW